MWVKQKTSSYNFPSYANASGTVFENPLADDYFIGRWFPMIVNGKMSMTAISGGQEIRVNFENTSTIGAKFYINPAFTATADTMPYIAWSIDDGAFTRQAIASNGASGEVTINFSTSATLGKHKLRIILDGVKENTERWGGVGLHFIGFNKNSGGIITPVPKRKKILYIGDSITEGVLVMGGTVSIPANNSAQKCYTHVSANLLNCDPIISAYGAVGVTRGGNGGVPTTQDNLFYYKASFPITVIESPSIIVINIGTNDTSATDDTFKTNYQTLINNIRAKYPNTRIIATNTFGGYKASAIQQVANANTNVTFLDVASWGVIAAGGGGLHPNATGQQLAGEKLAEAITTLNIL